MGAGAGRGRTTAHLRAFVSSIFSLGRQSLLGQIPALETSRARIQSSPHQRPTAVSACSEPGGRQGDGDAGHMICKAGVRKLSATCPGWICLCFDHGIGYRLLLTHRIGV